jgi:hypothetical protein
MPTQFRNRAVLYYSMNIEYAKHSVTIDIHVVQPFLGREYTFILISLPLSSINERRVTISMNIAYYK